MSHGLADGLAQDVIDTKCRWAANAIHSPSSGEWPVEVSQIPSTEPRVVLVNLCSPEHTAERQEALATYTLAGHLRATTGALVTVIDMQRHLLELEREGKLTSAEARYEEALRRTSEEILSNDPHLVGMTLKPYTTDVAKSLIGFISQATANVNAQVNEQISASIGLLYEQDETDLEVDIAILTFEPVNSNWSVSTGQLYVPFEAVSLFESVVHVLPPS